MAEEEKDQAQKEEVIFFAEKKIVLEFVDGSGKKYRTETPLKLKATVGRPTLGQIPAANPSKKAMDVMKRVKIEKPTLGQRAPDGEPV
jgi:hypothetical protein